MKKITFTDFFSIYFVPCRHFCVGGGDGSERLPAVPSTSSGGKKTFFFPLSPPRYYRD